MNYLPSSLTTKKIENKNIYDAKPFCIYSTITIHVLLSSFQKVFRYKAVQFMGVKTYKTLLFVRPGGRPPYPPSRRPPSPRGAQHRAPSPRHRLEHFCRLVGI